MKFSGWQKVSLTDYPKKVSSVVFTSTCNFDCEYCHNSALKNMMPLVHDEREVFNYFKSRGGLVDALVISGGEPTLWGDEISDFSRRFKLEFGGTLLKLDTNGSNPSFLEKSTELFDYVAMDFKAIDYAAFSHVPMEIISRSLGLLKDFREHEVRITLYPKYVDDESLKIMIDMLKLHKVENVSLQQYRKVNEVDPYGREYVIRLAEMVESAGFSVKLKGI